MRIVTFNIRCAWSGDGINSFTHRAGMIYEKIRTERPDVIAFQEVTQPIEDFLRHSLCDLYDVYAYYRSANFDGEGLVIALLRDSVKLDGSEYFWLSPTPDVPGSRFAEQSNCPRIAVVTLCRDVKSGEVIRLCNVHLDHRSDEARLLGIKLVLSRIEKLQSERSLETVILGDMNAFPDSPPMTACFESSLGLRDLAENIPFTYHGYGQKQAKIDYVFVTHGISARATNTKIWDDEKDGIYLSDHYPIEVEYI